MANRRWTWARGAGLALALLLGGCVSDVFGEGQFACEPGDAADACPEGLACAPDGLCRSPGSSGGAEDAVDPLSLDPAAEEAGLPLGSSEDLGGGAEDPAPSGAPTGSGEGGSAGGGPPSLAGTGAGAPTGDGKGKGGKGKGGKGKGGKGKGKGGDGKGKGDGGKGKGDGGKGKGDGGKNDDDDKKKKKKK
jgi:hypothetical protein